MLLVFTATPGTPDDDKLRLLASLEPPPRCADAAAAVERRPTGAVTRPTVG